MDYSPWGCRELDMTEHAVHNKYYIYMCVCVCVCVRVCVCVCRGVLCGGCNLSVHGFIIER